MKRLAVAVSSKPWTPGRWGAVTVVGHVGNVPWAGSRERFGRPRRISYQAGAEGVGRLTTAKPATRLFFVYVS